MNIPQRMWRVVRGRLLLARQRSREPSEPVVDPGELRAMADAVAELAQSVETPRRTAVERPGSRRIPPPSAVPRRDPLEPLFRALKLAPDADLAALEAAYEARLAETHPELHPVGSPEREAAEARKAALVDAYERLRDAINVTETRFEKLELDL
jgi:hypothetical protein